MRAINAYSPVGYWYFEAAYLTTPLPLFTVTGLSEDGPVMVAFLLVFYIHRFAINGALRL